MDDRMIHLNPNAIGPPVAQRAAFRVDVARRWLAENRGTRERPVFWAIECDADVVARVRRMPPDARKSFTDNLNWIEAYERARERLG